LINDINDINLNKIFSFKIQPTIERYYSEDSVWGVYVFKTNDEIPGTINEFDYDDNNNIMSNVHFSTLIGKMQKLSLGMEYDVKARFIYSKKYKSFQYEAISIDQKVPKTVENQFAFLKSIATENQAKVLLDLYPNLIEDVIAETDNIDLNLTKGVKEFTWNNIKTKILETYVMSDILVMLTPLGVSFNKIKKLFDNEPNANVLKQKLLDDPYVLAEVDGISFRTADNIALKLNPDLIHSKKRIVSFIKEYLKKLGENDGHTWVTLDTLEIAVRENLIECGNILEEVVEDEKANENFLHIEDDKIGLKYYWWIEKEIWKFANQFNQSKPLEISQEEIDNGIKIAEEQQGFLFSDEQEKVLLNCTKNNFNLITGFAGVGKSTITRGLLSIYKNYSIGCCTLSARAAKRLQETSGFPAMTIHRLLGARSLNDFEFNEDNKLPYNIILVDEFSMIYSGLFYYLFRAIEPNAKVILVGDVGQLPPLSFGSFPTDILNKSGFLKNELKTIHRQAEKSGIIKDSNLIRQGIDPLHGKREYKYISGELQDLFYMARNDRDELNDIAIKTYMKSINEVGIDNVQIIVPRKNDVINSTRKINVKIQDLLLDDTLPFVKYGSVKYKLGCKVMHIKNDYEKNIFNGNVGYIIHIYNMTTDGGSGLSVDYGDDKIIEYEKSELDEIEMAYAVTCHKIQGGQCHTVIGIIDNSHFMLLDQTLLYTMLTRGIKRVLLLFEPFAFNKCINENKITNRNTWTQFFE
jgi:exodeoxyribonuclease V alpha subunit